MKTILITGVSGFVGANLSRYFQKHSQINLLGHGRKRIDGIKFIETIDSKSLNENNVDVVIHLAGIAHDLSGQYKPEDYYKVNFEGTRKIVDEFLISNATKFIFVSSIKAAFDISSTPAEETMKPLPVTDYGKSKLMAEEYILSKAWNKKEFYILRPAMMHGIGNKGNLNLLYKFVKLGLPFPFGAFHNKRSFHSIDNFCFVIQSLIENKIQPGIYHLADDGFLSTTELYKIISEALNKKPRVWNLPKSLIETMAKVTGKRSTLNKLTEDMMVSNKKIVKAIGSDLPVTMKDGLTKTIQSFDGI